MSTASSNPAPRRGVLVIVSSPSGAGKTTLTRRLLGEFSNLEFSVSYTTRAIRPGERDGVDYHFIEPATFERMVLGGDFAEHAQVHGNWYGTAKAPIDAALGSGRDVIFDVDWQGGRALSAQWPDDSLKVFILPPDLETLAHRLRRRATDAPEVIERRLRKAIEELGHYDEYPSLIVNDDLDRAYAVLRAAYLLRCYGPPHVDGRPDAPFALAQLAALIEANTATRPDLHARQLIAVGAAPAVS
jgi:guanylate kinase